MHRASPPDTAPARSPSTQHTGEISACVEPQLCNSYLQEEEAQMVLKMEQHEAEVALHCTVIKRDAWIHPPECTVRCCQLEGTRTFVTCREPSFGHGILKLMSSYEATWTWYCPHPWHEPYALLVAVCKSHLCDHGKVRTTSARGSHVSWQLAAFNWKLQ